MGHCIERRSIARMNCLCMVDAFDQRSAGCRVGVKPETEGIARVGIKPGAEGVARVGVKPGTEGIAVGDNVGVAPGTKSLIKGLRFHMVMRATMRTTIPMPIQWMYFPTIGTEPHLGYIYQRKHATANSNKP